VAAAAAARFGNELPTRNRGNNRAPIVARLYGSRSNPMRFDSIRCDAIRFDSLHHRLFDQKVSVTENSRNRGLLRWKGLLTIPAIRLGSLLVVSK